jgi:predicted RNA-binding Zn-ribbon protein involved in translation (DUF1610 family)
VAVCEHNIRETVRGAGPCRIVSEVKRRDGKDLWWCRTHGQAASGPDGAALDKCPGAWFDPVPDEQRLELDIADGEIAVWGAIPPAIQIGEVPEERGKVHVHRRLRAEGSKDIDESYDIVTLRRGDRELVIEGTAAVAFSISELSGRPVTPLTCPHCGNVHIDELKFATFPHRKHQCNSCGRNFWDDEPSISNPLAEAHKDLGLPQPPAAERPDRPLELHSAAYRGVALWPSNSAIVSTMSRPEDEGIHVHAWDAFDDMIIDETYSSVTVDGEPIDENLLRMLAVQRALAHGAPIDAKHCAGCRVPLLSPTAGWLEPVTRHTCPHCGTVTKTLRRSFLNPLAARPWAT